MNSNKQNGLKLIRSRPAGDQDERCALGKSIMCFRLASGLSRAELAKRMEMTLGGVSAWEYGRTRPDIDSLKKLCAVLGVTSDELLGIEGTYSQLSDEEKSLIDTYRLLPEKERIPVFSTVQAGLVSSTLMFLTELHCVYWIPGRAMESPSSIWILL